MVEIGFFLTTFGAIFLFLGVLMFFDAAMLALGNFLFLAGIILLIGIQRTFKFFWRRGKIAGTICFIGGMCLVVIGWPIIGILIELFGFINLFGNFFPVVVTTLRHLPIIGPILNIPVISSAIDKIMGTMLPLHVSKR